jgi:hypothetical protein
MRTSTDLALESVAGMLDRRHGIPSTIEHPAALCIDMGVAGQPEYFAHFTIAHGRWIGELFDRTYQFQTSTALQLRATAESDVVASRIAEQVARWTSCRIDGQHETPDTDGGACVYCGFRS